MNYQLIHDKTAAYSCGPVTGSVKTDKTLFIAATENACLLEAIARKLTTTKLTRGQQGLCVFLAQSSTIQAEFAIQLGMTKVATDAGNYKVAAQQLAVLKPTLLTAIQPVCQQIIDVFNS